MNNLAITVKNLSKYYFIEHKNSPAFENENLTDFIATAGTTEQFWALNNVSFSVEHGTKLGLIGKNGAGKSTILKILSQITLPSEGEVTINGRMSSLLEVGTGFSLELTGRENIYLNGAILGMTRQQIKQRFDAIVDFSEIEKFIDTPMKHYSSGMQVRLGFSVAAHLEPDILILDEVLSVGDFQFQQKCLRKMNEINQSGSTILFVNHGADVIKQYCDRVILLEKGQIILDTENVDKAIAIYESEA
jgi:lipopolysaccharide transport system ATP-binding protein